MHPREHIKCDYIFKPKSWAHSNKISVCMSERNQEEIAIAYLRFWEME